MKELSEKEQLVENLMYASSIGEGMDILIKGLKQTGFAIDQVNNYCERSLNPDMFNQWEGIRDTLKERHSQ